MFLRPLSGRFVGTSTLFASSLLFRSSRCEKASTSSLQSVPIQDLRIATETKPKITLYQYKICPFCNRVKVYLDFLGIEYEAVEVNPLTKSEISFVKDYQKVPIAILDAEIQKDSGSIIDAITSKYISKENKKVYDVFFPPDTEKWGQYSEKELAVYLYPNITRSFQESWECFGYTSDVKSWNVVMQWTTRVAGAAAMTLANGKIKKKYNIVDERKDLKEKIKIWTDAIGGKKYLHGDIITMPDLQVFGVLRSIDGLTTFRELMNENPSLDAWYRRVATAIYGSP